MPMVIKQVSQTKSSVTRPVVRCTQGEDPERRAELRKYVRCAMGAPGQPRKKKVKHEETNSVGGCVTGHSQIPQAYMGLGQAADRVRDVRGTWCTTALDTAAWKQGRGGDVRSVAFACLPCWCGRESCRRSENALLPLLLLPFVRIRLLCGEAISVRINEAR